MSAATSISSIIFLIILIKIGGFLTPSKDMMFIIGRYIILNSIFIPVYYYFCNEPDDWAYDEHNKNKPEENALFNRVYHTLMVSTTIGDIHPRSVKARAITLVQAMLDFYLFGNIIYYMAYQEVNGF